MVERTLDLRVLIVTVVLGGALVGGVYALHEWQVARTAKGLQVLADREEQKSQWHKAASYLDRYLRLRPDDSGIAGRLALTYARGAESPAEKQRAVTLHYTALATAEETQETELHRGLATLLWDLGRFPEAESEARKLQGQKPDDPQAARVLALALASQLVDGSLARTDLQGLHVLAALETARRLNPADAQVATALALIYREWPAVVAAEFPQLTTVDRQQRSDAALDRLVQDNPQDALALLARYFHRMKYGLAGAADDLDAAVRLAPENRDVLLTAGGQALAEGRRLQAASPAGAADPSAATAKLEKARTFFERLVGQPVDERVPAAYLSLGECLVALVEREQALTTWREGLKHYRQPTIQIALHGQIAQALLDAARPDEATDSLDQIDKLLAALGTSVVRDARLALTREKNLRRATWHFRRNELGSAVPLLRSVIVSQPQGDTRVETTLQAWLLLGTVQFKQEEWVESATAFDEAAKLAPATAQPRLAAARAYLLARRPRLAAERAEQAQAIAGTIDAWMILAKAEFQEQVSLPAAERNWVRFQQALVQLEAAKPQLSEAAWWIDFLRIDYLMAEARGSGKTSDGVAAAAQVLNTAESAYSQHKEFWIQAALAYQNLGLAAEADRALATLRSAGATPVESAIVGARLAASRADYSRARTILEDAARSASASEHAPLRAELFQVAVAAKDVLTARGILLEEHRRQPQDLTLIRRLGEFDLEQRDVAAASEWAQKAAAEWAGVPGQTLAQYLRAGRVYLDPAADQPEMLTRALHDLEQVALARPNWAEAVALKGLVAIRLGRLPEAASDLERAVSLGDRRVFVFEQLIALLDQLQRYSDIEGYLGRLEAELPRAQRLSELATIQELRRERPENAVQIARQGVAQRPDDPLAHLWLGRTLMVAGALTEAEQSLERAVGMAPADPRVWRALVSLHTRTKDHTKTEQVLARLTQNAQLDAVQKSFLLAQCYEALGQDDAAKRQYGDVAIRSPSDVSLLLRVAQFHLKSDPHAAEQVLRKVLQIDEKSVVARRLLAVALAAQGEQGLEAAQSLLSEAGAEGTANVDDQRIRALLLVQQGGAANLDRAVKIVEQLVHEKAEPAASDRQLLAQLYERQAVVIGQAEQVTQKLGAAQQQIEQAAGSQPVQPASLAAAIAFFKRHDRPAEAASWLDKLEAAVSGLPKASADQLALVVQMQIELGMTDRCDKWLASLAKLESGRLRPVALAAEIAASRDPGSDVESQIEPKATELLAAANQPADQLALLAEVGDVYTRLNHHASAERWYRKLLVVAPDQFQLLVAALARQGKLADAIAVCEEGAKSDGTARPALVLVAVLTSSSPKEQDLNQAEPLLARALDKFDADVKLLYAATLLRLMQGKYDEATALYRKILAASPKHVPALNNLAMLLAEQPAERAEAIRLIDQAIGIVGQEPGLLDTKGAVLVYSSRSAEALPLLVAATRGAQADPRHHFHLAVAYRDQGQLEAAQAQLKIALDRRLDSQLLMPTDQRLLAEMRQILTQE